MDAPTTRIFTPARIVALALIGLAVLGLAYRAEAGPAALVVVWGVGDVPMS
jgi:hypothetical protein